MTTLPLDFPGLEAEARRMVGDILDTGLDGSDTMRLANTAQPLIRAHARLLADLTRPESQCFWLRALATHERLPLPRVGSPGWCRRRGGFYLSTPFGAVAFIDFYMNCMEAGHRIAGIGGIPNNTKGDAEALRLTLHAAFGVTP